MRFLLVLFAVLSGLSLGDVAHAASPAEVVGRAQVAVAEVAPTVNVCPVRARMARAAVRSEPIVALPLREAGLAISCGIVITDCPHE
jgi:hypothetical protein